MKKRQEEVVKYWLNASKEDIQTAEILFKNKRYSYTLFLCHLSIEKKLKALIVKQTNTAPPFTHDLVRLSQLSTREITQKHKESLAEINTFNIAARYDDYKLSFSKKATKSFTEKYLNYTKEILLWLQK